jgi:NADPH-dependent 2,4-dienoyl-CoA reductase/sulfur reductase-like enzyme
VAAGVTVAGVVDSRGEPPESADYPVYAGGQVIGTAGRLGLKEVHVRHRGGERVIWADCLGVSGGWNPTVHLTCHLGARPVWNPDILSFVPAPDAVPGLIPCGAAAGVMSTPGAWPTAFGRRPRRWAVIPSRCRAPRMAPMPSGRSGMSRGAAAPGSICRTT